MVEEKVYPLEGAIILKERIAIYIPHTVEVDITADNSLYVKGAVMLMSELFGGATAFKGIGGWISSDKGLITEEVTLVYSNTDVISDLAVDRVKSFAEYIKEELTQEAVSIEINGCLYLI